MVVVGGGGGGCGLMVVVVVVWWPGGGGCSGSGGGGFSIKSADPARKSPDVNEKSADSAKNARTNQPTKK